MSRSLLGALPLCVAVGALAMTGGAQPQERAAEVGGTVTAGGGTGLREAPDDGAAVVGTAAGGARIDVLCVAEADHGSTWYLVRADADAYAWAPAEDIRVKGDGPAAC
ncbi:SH3 domain-containing protein [Streptomyces sp. MS19]|uniref:SH3 domain-containing protein n=1 Tax=Streptomyces sp. MS19 TaxID=3385972 RepID=UPI0039A2D19B